MKSDGTRGIYIDMWASATPPAVDDFVVTVGKQGRVGTLYHVAAVRVVVPRKGTLRRLVRYDLRVFNANDLLKPDEPYQGLGFDGRQFYVPTTGADYKIAISITWYKRTKKAK